MHCARHHTRLLAGLAAVAALCAAAPVGAAQLVTVRVGSHPTFTRVVFELDSAAGYRIEEVGTESAPALRISVDAASRSPRQLRAAGDVRNVKVDAGSSTVAYVALSKSGLRLKESILANPPRIVLDLFKPETALAAAKPAKPASPPAPSTAATNPPATPATAPTIAKAEPKPAPAPTVEKAPVVKAEPKPAPAPAVEKPAPVVKAEPKPVPLPTPIVKADPAPKPVPLPTPIVKADPAPKPVPLPTPIVKADPQPPTPAPAIETPDVLKEAAEETASAPAITPAPRPADSPGAAALQPPPPAAPPEVAKTAPVQPVKPAPVTPKIIRPPASTGWLDSLMSHPLWLGGIAAALLALVAVAVVVRRRRRALPNDIDVMAIAEEIDGSGRIPSGGFEMDDAPALRRPSGSDETSFADLFDDPAPPPAERTTPKPAAPAIRPPAPRAPAPSPAPRAPAPSTPAAAPRVAAAPTRDESLFATAGGVVGRESSEGDAPMNQEIDLPADPRKSPPAPPPRMGGSAAAPSPDMARMFQEIERRMQALEARLDEANEAREKLERQVAAQSEELRVQRAAIARTQRALRTMSHGDEDKATEPALRDGDTEVKTRVNL